MQTSLTEWAVSREQEIHSVDTQTSLLLACDGPENTEKLPDQMMLQTSPGKIILL